MYTVTIRRETGEVGRYRYSTSYKARLAFTGLVRIKLNDNWMIDSMDADRVVLGRFGSIVTIEYGWSDK